MVRRHPEKLILVGPRIAYNVFNMDWKLVFIAKLPLILGVFA
jgi:hypothetical protein